jgi:predicted DNA-binding transcriptional regulator YafY
MSTSERMLRLLSLMQTHRYWPGPELAARLEVSERTLRRDVERLRDLGYDVDAVRGVSGGYQLHAGRALPPLLLDTDEAVAIAVGLRSTAAMVVDGAGDAAVSALTKVISMLPPALRRRMDALQTVPMPGPVRGAPTIDAEALTTLAACCRDREVARFHYQAANGEETERRVEPHELVSFGQRWYLVAYDTRRQDWRTFRLDRLRDVTTFGDRFKPREIPGGSALEHVKAARQSQPRRYEVVVRVALPAPTVSNATGGWGEVTGDDASSSWRISTDALDWPLMLLSNLDADFEIVSPPELSALVRRSAERMARCS